MERKELTKVLTFGVGVFALLSLVIRLGKIYFWGEFLDPFPWANQLGIGLIVFSALIFAFERLSNKPFFYGSSQRGGSNANSFIISAIGLNFLNLNNSEFFMMVLAFILAFIIFAFLIWKVKGSAH